MNYKIVIYSVFAIIDLVLSGQQFGSKGFWLCFLVLLFIGSLLWFGNIWNIMFQPGVVSTEHPIITREVPNSVLSLSGWILLVVLTLLLI